MSELPDRAPPRSLLLASTSPQRRAILEELGLPFEVVAPRYEERDDDGLAPAELVRAHAAGKARSVAGEAAGRVVFRYADAAGAVSDQANPNGSLNNIAGICNESRNVVGLMPHPERASSELLGSSVGTGLLQSLLNSARARVDA